VKKISAKRYIYRRWWHWHGICMRRCTK